MVQNTRVKRALSRKQVGVTPVSNTGIKPHTGDPHQFNTSIDPTKLAWKTSMTRFLMPSNCLVLQYLQKVIQMKLAVADEQIAVG